jgi:hypothetical protein
MQNASTPGKIRRNETFLAGCLYILIDWTAETGSEYIETIRLFFEWALRENDLEKVLRSPDDCECLPSHVELWCMKCKEKMVLKQSQSSGNGEEISEVARTALDPAPRH